MSQNYINHIAFVIDASSSMRGLSRSVVAVADQQIAYLAQRSKDLDQETRATVYTFSYSHDINCVFYDKDVLRMPSLSGSYDAYGSTALVDATLKAIADLEKTATLYGDHAFLIFVLTDGQENDSKTPNKAQAIREKLNSLPENWTVAVMVPDQLGVYEAKQFGFAAGNIAIWDTNEKGIAEVGEKFKRAIDNYTSARTQGIVGTRSLYADLDVKNLTPQVVKSALQEIPYGHYQQFFVKDLDPSVLKDFVLQKTGAFAIGRQYYELVKPEEIQAGKSILIYDRNTKKLYSGQGARQLIGLPDHDVKVHPANHPNYEIYVQSTSWNRRLVYGQKLIIL